LTRFQTGRRRSCVALKIARREKDTYDRLEELI
jgi:hypothetical protein